MSSSLGQTDRRFIALGRKALTFFALVIFGVSAWTVVASPANARTPKIKKPGAPTAVTAIAPDGSAAVAWTAPASDGGSAITGYTVTASHGGQTCVTTGATTCTVTGLTTGRLYAIKVRASNAKGEGPAARVQVTPLPTVSFTGFIVFPFTGGAVVVTLSQPASSTVQVNFVTSDGPATNLLTEE